MMKTIIQKMRIHLYSKKIYIYTIILKIDVKHES